MPNLPHRGSLSVDSRRSLAHHHAFSGPGFLRRLVDVAAAALMLAVTLPLLLLVALALRLEGPGPVLVRKPYVGRAGRRFDLFAFRSTWPGPFGRPVPTPLGSLIRPTRIDQLPVLLNLLRGDLTLVGPAPVAGPEAPQAPSSSPGVTGWVGAD